MKLCSNSNSSWHPLCILRIIPFGLIYPPAIFEEKELGFRDSILRDHHHCCTHLRCFQRESPNMASPWPDWLQITLLIIFMFHGHKNVPTRFQQQFGIYNHTNTACLHLLKKLFIHNCTAKLNHVSHFVSDCKRITFSDKNSYRSARLIDVR